MGLAMKEDLNLSFHQKRTLRMYHKTLGVSEAGEKQQKKLKN